MYDKGVLEMVECEVCGTVGREEPAVQAEGGSKLRMERCRVHTNSGADVRCGEEVEFEERL